MSVIRCNKIALLYKLLELVRLDYVEVLIIVPRILQALLSAYADLRFYNWSAQHKWAAFNIAVSWFWFYTASRTLINTLETSLTTIALSYFPWPGQEKGNNHFLWLVALLCTVRPTACIPWLPLCAFHILTTQENRKNVILKEYLPIGLVTLLLSVLVDSLCHGGFVVTSWQFLKLNVFHSVGNWYGTQPWHWYLSNGLPAILGIQILPFMFAAVRTVRNREIFSTNWILLVTIAFTVLVYSVLPHKEFRFILPVLPMALYVSSDFITRWSYKANNVLLWFVAAVLFVSNIVPAWYLGMVHQRGTLDVMSPLAKIAADNPRNTSILFLMPCHSTPLYSHLHVNVTTRFLTCEPDLTNTPNYKDEADMFYDQPNKWLHTHYPPNGTLPTHIVTFDTVVPTITSILSRYKPTHRFFHTTVPTSTKVGHFVIIHELV
ncbi:Phosphatidylinositol glycan anchor biosynthesis class B [Carabus blaptoides fortunei]